MLAAPPPLSDRDEVIALLRAWHAESPGTRHDPRTLEIRSIVAIPIHRIAITRIAENRGTGVRARAPAERRSPGGVSTLDAWAYTELDLPADSRLGQRVERDLQHEPERVSDCERCRGRGRITCTACNGVGTQGHGKHRHRCMTCDGNKEVACTSCMGLGGFSGPPFVWSAIVEGTVTRVVRAPGISDEALLDIDAVLERGLGTIVTRDDAWSGTFDASAGYRGGDTTSELAEHVRALYAELEATSTGRARGHKLEIKRAAAYTVTLGDGRALTVWGPPAKVSPPDALDAPGRALLRNLGLLAIGFFVALVLMWLTRHGR